MKALEGWSDAHRLQLVLRLSCAALLLLSWLAVVAGWTLPGRARPPLVAVALDLSASVDARHLAAAMERIVRLEREVPIVLVPFGAEARPVDDLAALRALGLTSTPAIEGGSDAATRLDTGRTDLESALTAAKIALEDADPQRRHPHRILLLSDGLENRGSIRTVLDALAREEVLVDVDPLSPARPELWVSPPRAADDSPLRAALASRVEIDVWSDTERAASLTVTPVPSRGELTTTEISLVPGNNTVVTDLRPDEAGLLEMRSELRDDEGELLASSESAWLQVGPALRLLLLADPEPAGDARAWLERNGWRVDQRRPERAPVATSELRPFDAALLVDVEAKRLTTEQMGALESWVVDEAGGLLFVAGPSTYGDEGYTDSTLEEILPARFEVEEERSDIALMIALDKSYSMRGDKMELAKEASKAVVGELDDDHRFGLVAFDWNPYRAVPLQVLSDREAVLDAISRVEAGAQTNFYPALQSAHQQLSEVEAEVEHVILISDGRTYPDDYEELLGRMRADGITVSTVAVGQEADRALLEQIAEWGDGDSYFVEDARRVQSILLDEARARTEDTVVEEDTLALTATATTAISGIEIAELPPLRGYTTMTPHPRAQVVLATDDDKPLLARRNVGLGRTWILATDLGTRWATDWFTDGPGQRLFFQVLLDAVARRPIRTNRLEITTTRSGVRVELAAWDESGLPWLGPPPRATLEATTADGDVVAELENIELLPVSAGRYRSAPIARALDDLDAELRAGASDGTVMLARTRRPSARRAELRPTRLDEPLLREVAGRTGGTFRPSDEELFAARGGSTRGLPLWPILATAALFCYLGELLLRRTGWLRRTVAPPERTARGARAA